MKVLLIGGSRMVGSFITPYLAKHHTLRVLDVVAPVRGPRGVPAGIDLRSLQMWSRALDGMDTFVNLDMRSPQGGSVTDQDLTIIKNHYEVKPLGLHLLLWTAQGMGIKQGVYTSTMSVHHREWSWYPSEDSVPLDSPSAYGLTKGLGEQICAYFARWFDMRIVALRITGPRTREGYLAEGRNPIHEGLSVTDEEDLARAYLAAIDAVQEGHARFDAVWIAGDEREETHDLTKARTLLGWMPESQRYLEE